MKQPMERIALQLMARQFRMHPLGTEYIALSQAIAELGRFERFEAITEHAYETGDLDFLELVLDPDVVEAAQKKAAQKVESEGVERQDDEHILNASLDANDIEDLILGLLYAYGLARAQAREEQG